MGPKVTSRLLNMYQKIAKANCSYIVQQHFQACSIVSKLAVELQLWRQLSDVDFLEHFFPLARFFRSRFLLRFFVAFPDLSNVEYDEMLKRSSE